MDFLTPGCLKHQPEWSYQVYKISIIIHSFAYRSVHDFESEQLQYGTGVKPECQILDGDLLQTIPVMMNEQRAIQATYSHPERIHIGGEMIAHYLTSSMYQCFKIGEFEDFRTQGEYILSRI